MKISKVIMFFSFLLAVGGAFAAKAKAEKALRSNNRTVFRPNAGACFPILCGDVIGAQCTSTTIFLDINCQIIENRYFYYPQG